MACLTLALAAPAQARPWLTMHRARVAIAAWARADESKLNPYRRFSIDDCRRESATRVRCAVVEYAPGTSGPDIVTGDGSEPLSPDENTLIADYSRSRPTPTARPAGTITLSFRIVS